MAEELVNLLVEALQKLQPPQLSTSTVRPTDGFQLQPFNENDETFDNYISRLENFFELKHIAGTNDETNARKIQIFLNCLSPRVFQALMVLTAPRKPNEKSYEELVCMLKGHLCPKASEMAEQHRFVFRLQEDCESIGQYVTSLKQIANNCNFVCTNCKTSTMDVHIRSQLIRGVSDNEICERILQQGSALTLEETTKLALATEAAKLESQQMQTQRPSISAAVNKVNLHNKFQDMSIKEKVKSLRGHCFRCGSESHKSNECNARDKTCQQCRKVGHIAKVCFTNSRSNFTRGREQKQLDRNSSSTSVDPCSRSHDEDIFCVRQYKGSRNDKMMIEVTIDDKHVNLELDTGAAVTTMSLETFQNLFPGKSLQSTNLKLRTYTNEVIKPLGVCQVKVKHDSTTVKGDLYALSQNVDSIMGREWIRKVNGLTSDL